MQRALSLQKPERPMPSAPTEVLIPCKVHPWPPSHVMSAWGDAILTDGFSQVDVAYQGDVFTGGCLRGRVVGTHYTGKLEVQIDNGIYPRVALLHPETVRDAAKRRAAA